MATFADLEETKREVITEYGERLLLCKRRTRGVIDAISLFIHENGDEFPLRWEKEIKDGIAKHADIKPSTFALQLSQGRRGV